MTWARLTQQDDGFIHFSLLNEVTVDEIIYWSSIKPADMCPVHPSSAWCEWFIVILMRFLWQLDSMAPDGLRPVVSMVLTCSLQLFHITQGLILINAVEGGWRGGWKQVYEALRLVENWKPHLCVSTLEVSPHGDYGGGGGGGGY